MKAEELLAYYEQLSASQ